MFKPVSFFGKLFKFYLLFPAHPAKIRIENIAGKLFFPSGITLKNEEGVFFKLDANDWITRTMIEAGNYEKESVQLGKKLLSNGGIFIDIGANFGLYTCQLGFHNQGVQVYAVEPNYLILGRLISNCRLNKLQNNIHIINAAISEKFQMFYLQLPISNNLGSTVATLTDSGGVSVLSCSLSYILTCQGIQQVDLLKIDIEGNEFEVLEKFSFEEYRINNIILEFNHLAKISLRQLKDFFVLKGFELFTVEGIKLTSDEQLIPENNIWLVNTLQANKEIVAE